MAQPREVSATFDRIRATPNAKGVPDNSPREAQFGGGGSSVKSPIPKVIARSGRSDCPQALSRQLRQMALAISARPDRPSRRAAAHHARKLGADAEKRFRQSAFFRRSRIRPGARRRIEHGDFMRQAMSLRRRKE
jgi:hypothetical protein